MTPREPDRFMRMALLVDWKQEHHTRGTFCQECTAAAIRQAADDALERAAQALESPSLPGDLPFREAADVVRALASPAAAPAAEEGKGRCDCDVGIEGGRPPPEPVAPSLLPRVLAALEIAGTTRNTTGHAAKALAAELRRYIAEMEAGHAEAPDAERDRNRHNAMLVEAWREEFSTLCKVLFPGNAGPIGWKHVQAKIAEREKRIAELERAYRAYAEWATSEFGARAWQSGESYTEWQTRLAASEKPAP